MTDPGDVELRVAVDVGGTFTDLVSVDRLGNVRRGKVLTTPDNPAAGVLRGLTRLMGGSRGLNAVAQILHGTTLATNAVIERRGAPTAVVTTKGFRDVLVIGRERRFDVHDLTAGRSEPLVPRSRCYEIDERLDARGEVVVPLAVGAVEHVASELRELGIRSVAVCLLHAPRNPAHERIVADELAKHLPGVHITCSSDVDPYVREFERMSTTVVSAYVQPLVVGYLRDLENALSERGYRDRLWVMTSSGGIATAASTHDRPVQLLESGPAGGVLFAGETAQRAGYEDALAFDVGGTTAKVCLVHHGEPATTRQTEVARVAWHVPGSGLPVRVPIVDITEIGTGGGSIAGVGVAGTLTVGPRSAGADPGPACYGRGGEQPTVTDAAMVLGYLDPTGLLGGELPIDRDAAMTSIERYVSGPLGLGLLEGAQGIFTVAVEQMALAIRMHLVQRGHDPAELVIVALGGAGPLFLAPLMASLGTRTALCPPGAGVGSAEGFLTARPAVELTVPVGCSIEDVAASRRQLAEAEAAARARLHDMGCPADQTTVARSAAVRYRGQGYEVGVSVHVDVEPTADLLLAEFERRYLALFGSTNQGVSAELVAWHVRAQGPRPLTGARDGGNPAVVPPASEAGRTIMDPKLGEAVEASVHERSSLGVGDCIDGPAIIQEPDSSLLLPTGFRATLLDSGDLEIQDGASDV